MTKLANLFAAIPASLPAELTEILFTTPSLRIERIVSHGHSSPEGFWYNQDQDEWVLLVAGAAQLQLETEVVELKPGSFVNIPAHCRHRVQWTDPELPTIWLAIFYRAETSSRS